MGFYLIKFKKHDITQYYITAFPTIIIVPKLKICMLVDRVIQIDKVESLSVCWPIIRKQIRKMVSPDMLTHTRAGTVKCNK